MRGLVLGVLFLRAVESLQVPPAAAAAAASASSWTSFTAHEFGTLYEVVNVRATSPGPPAQRIEVADITPKLTALLASSGLQNGCINVISRHTTTAITINERENRLAQDMQEWFLRLAPPDDRSFIGKMGSGVQYKHNDIDSRPDGDEEAER
jgi:hypothetical protein